MIRPYYPDWRGYAQPVIGRLRKSLAHCQKLSFRPRGGNTHSPDSSDTGLVGDRVMNGKSTNKSVPKPPRCVKCARQMQLLRQTSRFGGLPDLYSFYCVTCEEWHVEEGVAA